MTVIGINEHGEGVHIDQVKRGATELRCPYCHGLLTAKKGAVNSPHFAHTYQTCRQTARPYQTVALPGYDNFNAHLPGRALKELQKFATAPQAADQTYLAKRGVIEGDPCELTDKGRLVLGQLSLARFNDYQESLILAKLQQLENTARIAYKKSHLLARWDAQSSAADGLSSQDYSDRITKYRTLVDIRNLEDGELSTLQNPKLPDFETAITDLRLYRAQFRRILSYSLYFLRIVEPDLYKIGVTTRDIAQRLPEIRAELQVHCGPVTIEVIGIWPHRGNVELYFKHRYKLHRQPLGDLTEYFKFRDIRAVRDDLYAMQPKALSDVEQAILDGKPSSLEQELPLEQAAQQTVVQFAVRKSIASPRSKTDDYKAPIEMRTLDTLQPRHQSRTGFVLKAKAGVEYAFAHMTLRAFWKRFTSLLDS